MSEFGKGAAESHRFEALFAVGVELLKEACQSLRCCVLLHRKSCSNEFMVADNTILVYVNLLQNSLDFMLF